MYCFCCILNVRDIFMFDGGSGRLRSVTNLYCQCQCQYKVIHRRTREIICNTFDYMRITFPFEALTKTGFLRICFFNLFSENLNLPRHSLLRRLSEIWQWQYIFVTFLSLSLPPPNMKMPLQEIRFFKIVFRFKISKILMLDKDILLPWGITSTLLLNTA
jgi:hypothetical protein